MIIALILTGIIATSSPATTAATAPALVPFHDATVTTSTNVGF